MGRILIVDDEASICWAFRESLGDLGHNVEVAASAEEGLQIASRNNLDVVVLDIRLPGMDGLAAMRTFRECLGAACRSSSSPPSAIWRPPSGPSRGERLRNTFVKPFDLDQATSVIKRALEKKHAEHDQHPAPVRTDSEVLIGSSPAMQELFKNIALVAPAGVPVLITGESGTGKELVARAIHRHSGRRDGPFLPICLAALSPSLVERELFGHVKGSFTGAVQDRKGLLELANGGTVLLDEIGDIALSLQVKLLRAIEHGEVTPVGDARPRPIDIRVIAATNQPLGTLMTAGAFREDLFFRLSVFQIHIPPLRERRQDIPALADAFLREARLATIADTRITGDVMAELQARAWTGNVRELRNAIEHAAIIARGQPIRLEHFPAVPATRQPPPPSSQTGFNADLAAWVRRAFHDRAQNGPAVYEQFLELAEPPLLQAALEECGGNRAAAAQILGIHRATLRQKLRKYGIE